jgi:exopolysaccharide production protein ExoZ
MLSTIQTLRGLAAFLVVLVHLPVFVRMAGGPADPFFFGNAGVDLFFVVSGLIMVYTTDRRERRPADFLLHRVARIIPLYWVVTIAVFAIAIAAPSLLETTHADLIQLIKSLLFIPFRRVDGTIAPVVFVGWTLNYEMFFYLIFTISLLFRARRAGMSFLFATLLGLVLFGEYGSPRSLALQFFSRSILLEFAFGVALGLVWPYIPGRTYLRWPAFLLGCLSLILLIWLSRTWPNADRILIFGVPALFMVFSGLLLEKAGAPRIPLLGLLGDSSYSIYLTHFFLTQASVKIAETLNLAGILPIAALFMLTIIGVGVLGILTHHLIERPLTEAARQMFGISARRATCPRGV